MNTETLIQVVGWAAAIYFLFRACRWAYRLGYGNAPQNVCEPVSVLSTGERPEHNHDYPSTGHGQIAVFNRKFEMPYSTAVTFNDTFLQIYNQNPYDKR